MVFVLLLDLDCTKISKNMPHFVCVLKSFFVAMVHRKLILKPNKLRYFWGFS